MMPKELDVVLLDDGREATVLEAYEAGTAFYVECPNPATGDSDLFMVELAQIKKVIWHA